MHFLPARRVFGVAALCALAGAALACGAKTGLPIPDVVHRDVTDVVCTPGRVALTRPSAEVMFVIDRSSSMDWGLEGSRLTRPRRWDILQNVLEMALPPFENTVDMGAAFFPRAVGPTPNIADLCVAGTSIDVEPGPGNASRIISFFATTQPGGGTPTFDALLVTGRFLLGRAARGRAQYIVLATDGGPNCNGALDRLTCACTSVDDMGNPTCGADRTGADGRFNCLDDRRTIDAIAESASRGVPTFVIGIDDVTRVDLTQVLNRMAIAGGRPNTRTGGERYYSARRRQDLLDAFDTIQRTIARCAFVLSTPLVDPDALVLESAGMEIPRDETRREGWDWTNRDAGEITLFGRYCDAMPSAPSVTATISCPDAGATR
jgi:hypothetical protein